MVSIKSPLTLPFSLSAFPHVNLNAMSIRYGTHCFLFTEHWNDKDLIYFDVARNLGLEHFEIAVGDDVSFDLKETRKRAESLGLQLTLSPGNVWPFECDLNSEKKKKESLG